MSKSFLKMSVNLTFNIVYNFILYILKKVMEVLGFPNSYKYRYMHYERYKVHNDKW